MRVVPELSLYFSGKYCIFNFRNLFDIFFNFRD